MIKKVILIIIIPAAAIFLGFKFIKISTADNSILIQHKSKSSGSIENSPFQKEYLSKDGLVVVNVWATWCKPCIQEIPTFKKISKENPNIKFVFLSIDEDSEKLKTFLAKNTINDITLQNTEYIEAIKTFLGGNGLLGYRAIPLTFIIKNGKVIDKNVGSIDYTELSTQLKALQ